MLTETAKASIIQKVEEIKALMDEAKLIGRIDVSGRDAYPGDFVIDEIRTIAPAGSEHWSHSSCWDDEPVPYDPPSWNASNC
ncbi:hypothetical protein [Xanthomonas phage X1]|nr:hypothetical protein [Xanthomonas phage X1]